MKAQLVGRSILFWLAFSLLAGCQVKKTQEGKIELPKFQVQKTQDGQVQLPKFAIEPPKIQIQKTPQTVTVPTVKQEKRTVDIPTGIQVKPAGNPHQ
jgi:hypothetical protein